VDGGLARRGPLGGAGDRGGHGVLGLGGQEEELDAVAEVGPAHLRGLPHDPAQGPQPAGRAGSSNSSSSSGASLSRTGLARSMPATLTLRAWPKKCRPRSPGGCPRPRPPRGPEPGCGGARPGACRSSPPAGSGRGAAEDGVGPGPDQGLLRVGALALREQDQHRDPTRDRGGPDAAHEGVEGGVRQPRPQDDEAGREDGDRLDQLAGRGLLLDHVAVPPQQRASRRRLRASSPETSSGGLMGALSSIRRREVDGGPRPRGRRGAGPIIAP